MFGLLFGLTLGIGCKSEIDGKEAAVVNDVPSSNTAKTATDPAKKVLDKKPEEKKTSLGAMKLTPTSKVEWVGAKVTGDHTGGFKVVTGEATQEGGKLTSLTASIDINSVFSDHPKLTKHLLNDDFFSVAKFPMATFSSTKIGEGKITGVLDMRAIKKEITFPARVSISKESIDIKAEFSINRKLWEVNYNGKANNLIKDDVLIKLDVQYK